MFARLVGKYFRSVPADRRIPRFGDKRTHDREGLNKLVSAAGFGELTWEQSVVGRKATAAELWDEFRDSLYGLERLEPDDLGFAPAVTGRFVPMPQLMARRRRVRRCAFVPWNPKEVRAGSIAHSVLS